ncbi:MAG: GvpL/GvpF family gas vesicle protein [Patescibacteria group bacterium]
MNGFYVYCIRPKHASALPAKGVKFAKSIKVFPFKDIEAVVGEIDPSKLDGEKIKDKILDDPKWAEENIRAHHEVIDRAFQTSVVIPMKFGMMYRTKISLVETLEKYYRKFKSLISRLQDRKEWGVKAYLDHKKFIEGLKKKNKEIQKLEKRRSSVQKGMRWYTERKVDEIVAKELEEEIEKELQYLVGKVEKYTEEIRLNEILSKDIHEPAREVIMNAACLVKNDALKDFKGLFQELAKEATQKGILLELTGPWPPYNFVDVKNE